MNQKPEDYLIEVHDLTITYQYKPAVWNLDFYLPKNQMIGILGPNGSGKSTVLKAIMGIVKPDKGYIKMNKQSVSSQLKTIAYIPQKQSIDWNFPTTVYEVVKMGRIAHLGLFKRYTKNDYKIIDQAIEMSGLTDLKKRSISELSGGQQQRTFIARAIAQQPETLFLDEPFAGVDAKSEENLMDIFNELKTQNKTIIMIHHDLISAQSYFQWLLLLNTRLVANGPTELIYTKEILAETFGGKLPTLSNIGNYLKNKHLPLK